MQSAAKQSGFTLIEMLISLFIFAVISAGTMMALNGALRGKEQINTATARLAQIDIARALIRADMAQLVLRPVRDAFGNFEIYTLQSGTGTLLRFTRKGRANPAGVLRRGDVQRLAYVFEDGSLIRRVQTQANPAPQSPTIDRTLISDLVGVELVFVANDEEISGLSIPINATQKAPPLMKLNLIYNNGDALTQVFEVAS